MEEFHAGENKSLAVARLRNTSDGSEKELEITGAFIAVGHDPQSQLVQGQVETDDAGYVVTQGKSTLTSVPGVFAAGDLVDHTYRQAITAAGSGCQAALDAEWYLRDTAPFESRARVARQLAERPGPSTERRAGPSGTGSPGPGPSSPRPGADP